MEEIKEEVKEETPIKEFTREQKKAIALEASGGNFKAIQEKLLKLDPVPPVKRPELFVSITMDDLIKLEVEDYDDLWHLIGRVLRNRVEVE